MSKNSLMLQMKSALAGAFLKKKIKIEHTPSVSVPQYDRSNNRILLPNWSDISPDLYDTLCGNATAHAEWTPNGSVKACGKAIEHVCPENLKTGETYLKTVEDSRVERLLFSKYVGYKKRFKNGYSELAEGAADFEYDIDKINASSFVDRYNFFFKFGDTDIEFTDKEMKLVEKGSKILTWKDSVRLAKAMYEQDVENQQSQSDDNDQQQEGEGESDEENENEDQNSQGQDSGDTSEQDVENQDSQDDDSSDGSGDSDGENDDENQDEDGSGDGSDDGENDQDGDSDGQGDESSDQDSDGDNGQGDSSGDQDSNGGQPSQGQQGGTPSQPKQVDHSKLGTMSSQFEEAKKNLDQDKSHNPKYDYAQDIDTTEGQDQGNMTGTGVHSDVQDYDDKINSVDALIHDKHPTLPNPESRGRANKLAAKFNLSLNAKIYEKTRVHKTGELNMNKLHEYMFTDDIFLSDEEQPEGKNHAVTMLIDCSMSMDSVIGDVFVQMHDLILFCRSVDIPFRVYGFTSIGYSDGGQVFEIIRSDYPKAKYKDSMERIYAVMKNGSSSIRMSGTPLLQALDVIKKTNHLFLNANGSDVHNVFVLTDGEGSNWGNYVGDGAIVENGKMYPKGRDSWDGAFLICDFMKNLHANTNVAWFHINSSNRYDFTQYGMKKDLDRPDLTVYESGKVNGSPDVLFHFKNERDFYKNYEVFTEKLVRNMRSGDGVFL